MGNNICAIVSLKRSISIIVGSLQMVLDFDICQQECCIGSLQGVGL